MGTGASEEILSAIGPGYHGSVGGPCGGLGDFEGDQNGDGLDSRGPQGKDLATDIVGSKGEPIKITNGPSREHLIGDEFIFNMVQHQI